MPARLQYQPLKRDPPEIRVLELHSSLRSSSDLHCTLRHRRLDQAEYAALSYVWGQQTHDTALLKVDFESALGTQYLTIGSNLARALRCLRRKTKNVLLWTDAVCIDQDPNDRRERSWQVEMMRSIYARATEVHSWLGPRYQDVGGNVETAFKLAESLWEVAQRMQFSNRPKTEEQWLQVCFTLANIDSSDDSQERSKQAQRWSGYAKALRSAAISNSSVRGKLASLSILSRNDYFARMWVLQETGRARTLTFHHGGQQVSHIPTLLALCMGNSLRDSANHPEARTALHGFSPRFLRCLEARTTCGQQCSVREVLEFAYFSPPPRQLATDNKDLIYARLGLASDQAADREGVKVNYDVDTETVFGSATRFLLSEGFLDPLVAYTPYLAPDALPRNSLPSWAYDWSQEGIKNFAKFKAAKNTTSQVSFIPYPGAKLGEALQLQGINVGVIRAVGSQFSKVVKLATFSDQAVIRGGFDLESQILSAQEKEQLLHKIRVLHQELRVNAQIPNIEKLFDEYTLPLSKFWLWWLHWILEIRKLAPVGAQPDNISDMLFHQGSANLSSDITRLISLESLVDLQRWLKLFFASHAGAALAETAFRSARGMRPAVLDSGRLCYVPELSISGDRVVICHGVAAPMVLRRQSDKKAMRIVGPSYVRGVMWGEAMSDELEKETFAIV